MSKKRNRSIKINYKFSPDFLRVLPVIEKVTSGSKRISVADNRSQSSASSSDYNANSGSSDFDIVSYDKTSSDSVSWCDDFDTEATQRVQKEFYRMERVLQGLEEIPPNYNRDEYELWTKTFPQLRIYGIKPKTSEIKLASGKKLSPVISNSLLDDYRIEPTSLDIEAINNNFKSSVIDEVFERVSSRLINNRKRPHSRLSPIKLKGHVKTTVDDMANQFGDILRITPTFEKAPDYLRQQSSNSVTLSEKSSAKWMYGKPSEYSSLPYLTNTSAKGKVRSNYLRQKNLEYDKLRSSSKLSHNKSNNCVILPPIETSALMSSQYRSISATSRNIINRPSAISDRLNSKLVNRNFSLKATRVLGEKLNQN